MPEPLLRLEGVSHAYPAPGGGGPLWTLREVALALAPGEAVGLCGASGAGKSTLARLCLGLERPAAGRVFFAGHDLAGLAGRELRGLRRRFQVVWQDPYLYLNPFQSVARSVAEVLAAHGLAGREERPARVAALLREVGLDPALAGRRPHELSGGQGQRAALARALASGPELLICDEALTGLDTASQARLLRHLVGLNQKGLALLFISHDRALLRRLGGRVLHLAGGRLGEGFPPGG